MGVSGDPLATYFCYPFCTYCVFTRHLGCIRQLLPSQFKGLLLLTRGRADWEAYKVTEPTTITS